MKNFSQKCDFPIDDCSALHYPSFRQRQTRPEKPIATMTTIAKVAASKGRAPITKSTLIEARDRLQELKAVQNEAREEELKIRTFLADKLHTEESGAKTTTIEGIKVTVTRTLTTSISREEADRLVQEHPDLSLEVLRWKPEARPGEFKKHPELAEFIVVKPGPPNVDFK